VHVAVGEPGPALDPGEHAFGPRPVPVDPVPGGVRRFVLGLRAPPAVAIGFEGGDQILGAGKQEGVGAVVAGQAPVGPAGHLRHRHRPADPEGAVALAGAVRQRQRRAEPAAPGARGDRNRNRRRAGKGVGAKRLADAADRATGDRQRKRGRGDLRDAGHEPGADRHPGPAGAGRRGLRSCRGPVTPGTPGSGRRHSTPPSRAEAGQIGSGPGPPAGQATAGLSGTPAGTSVSLRIDVRHVHRENPRQISLRHLRGSLWSAGMTGVVGRADTLPRRGSARRPAGRPPGALLIVRRRVVCASVTG